MSWRERYLEASFRGVKFYVTASPAEFGRHKVVHEFPSATEPYIEDQGKKAARYPIEGFVIGEDYNFTRDLLIKASEEIGAGELVHPFLGIKSVECLSLKVRESFDEGSLAALTFQFVEAGTERFGFPVVDEILTLLEAVDDFLLDQVLAFQKVFSVLKAPGYIIDSAAGLLGRLADTITSQNGLGVIGATIDDLSESILGFRQEAISLVKAPKDLAEAITSALEDLAASFDSPLDGITSLARVARTELQTLAPSPFETATRKREQQNARSLAFVSKAAAVTAAVRSLASFTELSRPNRVLSTTDAIKLRDQIIEILDDLIMDADFSAGFHAMIRLKTSLLKAIPTGIDLVPSKTILVPTPTTAFNLATELYGDPSRYFEIIDRNGIENPALILPGTSIEYIASS